MHNVKIKAGFALCAAMILMFSGCAHFNNSEKASAGPADPSVADGKPAKEIVELNDIIRQNPGSSKAKKAHLKLAKLYSDYNNGSRNYRKALEHLEAYYILEDSGTDDETMRLMGAFREIERLSKEIGAQKQQIHEIKDQLEKTRKAERALSRTNRKLTREEIKLREQNRSLEQSNQKLQQTIELLTDLNQRMEEKRRNFNN